LSSSAVRLMKINPAISVKVLSRPVITMIGWGG
jgi:hypothetical protein